MKLTFLGTGTSHGVPVIECMFTDYAQCKEGVCQLAAEDPKHARMRCSALIQHAGRNLLIDVGPDFRTQMLQNRVKHLDAVLLTHSHADHIQGLSDIRSYCHEGNPLDIYSAPETIDAVRNRYQYIFNPPPIKGGGIPDIATHTIAPYRPFTLLGLNITPILVEHGSLRECLGFRINNLGYVSDVKVMPERSKTILQGIDVLVLDALRPEKPHATHIALHESIALAQELGAKQCYFVHMNHDIHYAKHGALLPPNMAFAYDGLQIDIPSQPQHATEAQTLRQH